MKWNLLFVFTFVICGSAFLDSLEAGRGGSRDDHSGGSRNNSRNDGNSDEDSEDENSGSGSCDGGSGDQNSDDSSSGGDDSSDNASDNDSDNDSDDDSNDNGSDDGSSGHGSSDRRTICHIPPGNPENAHSITVGASAVAAHLAHGDTEGECDTSADDCLTCAYDLASHGAGECAQSCGFLIK